MSAVDPLEIEKLALREKVIARFPKKTLLESGEVPIVQLAELALREGQCTNPIYRVHRWFARRLGS
jgi:hypothetical protein